MSAQLYENTTNENTVESNYRIFHLFSGHWLGHHVSRHSHPSRRLAGKNDKLHHKIQWHEFQYVRYIYNRRLSVRANFAHFFSISYHFIVPEL